MEDIKRLSFSNIPLQETPSPISKSSPPRSDPFFEFAGAGADADAGDIVFCGKVIRQDEDELNEYEKRDYFANIRSQSLRGPDRGSGNFAGDLDNHAQSPRMNTTPMSSKSKRRMSMFGSVKLKPEMELGDIKRRQKAARRPPPAVPEKRTRANEFEIVQPSLRGRSYFMNFLARSLACI